jgi:SAM-dependent methyltransferase
LSTRVDELTSAYEGLEAAFSDEATLAAYREAMLARSAEQADFLAPLLERASVVEIGCGNGRLLIELGRRRVVSQGLGLDLARSRIQFARQWSREQGLDELRFAVADAIQAELPAAAYDAVLCITGTFAYFEPLGAGTGARILRRWASALRPGGLLVLELYAHAELLPLLDASPAALRLWRELEPEDPWRFYLSELRLEDRILVHHKTFVHRTTGEVDSGRTERLMLYTAEGIAELLAEAGMSQVECLDGWTGRPYAGAEALVVTARAPRSA